MSDELIIFDEAVEMTEEDFLKVLHYGRNREKRLLYGEWLIETEQERLHREIAETYHRRCDAYDATVCSGMRDGEPMPIDGHETGLINRNARLVRSSLMAIHNLTEKKFHDIITKHNKVNSHHNH